MPKSYKVVEADYYDELDGLKPGVIVTAVPGEIGTQMLVTGIGENELKEPIAVMAGQLQEV